MEMGRADSTMVGDRVMLRVVVALVVAATLPVDHELFLAGAVTHPVETHVDGFGTFLLD